MLDRVSFNGGEGVIAYPKADQAPALVVLQEWWGINDQIQAIARATPAGATITIWSSRG